MYFYNLYFRRRIYDDIQNKTAKTFYELDLPGDIETVDHKPEGAFTLSEKIFRDPPCRRCIARKT